MGGESSDFAMLCETFPNLAPDDQLALALTLDLPQEAGADGTFFWT